MIELCGPSTLTNDAASLSFGGSTPHAHLLATCERMFETRDTNIAAITNSLGHLGLVLVIRKEDLGVQTPTCPQIPPDHFAHDVPYRVPRGGH